MGRTNFSGPVYGGKAVLASFSRSTVATDQTDLEIFEVNVPADEDWYITGVRAYCDGAGSAAATLDVEDDGASMLDAAITLVSDDEVVTDLDADSGEDAGHKVEASSVITVDATTGTTTAPTEITVQIEGFRRYIPSNS